MNRQSTWSFVCFLTISDKKGLLALILDRPHSRCGAATNGQDKTKRYVNYCPVDDGFDLVACLMLYPMACGCFVHPFLHFPYQLLHAYQFMLF